MEFLNIFCNWHLRRHWKKRQSWKGFVFVVLDEVTFLDNQFLVANPFNQLAHVLNDSFVNSHLHLYGAFANYLPVGYSYRFRARGHRARLVDEC